MIWKASWGRKRAVTAGAKTRREKERGSALVIAILLMVIISLMGLAFALVADTENKISFNERCSTQALYVAEGTVRLVKQWFDDPSSGYLVPTTSQVDRSLRYVDNDGDGTYQLYTTAPAPWNVTYRSDLFGKPYRGSPDQSLEGTQSNPDVRISQTGSAGEQNFLTNLNNTLFPAFPSPNLRARIRQIDVYAPPIISVSGQRTRFGIGTILVTAGIYEYPGTASEKQIAERVVKAVINETPYPGPLGPLQSCGPLNFTGGSLQPHWGIVTSSGDMTLQNNIDSKIQSSVPWYTQKQPIARDMNLDGTLGGFADDFGNDGTLDFDQWLADPVSDGTVEDPWLHFWSERDITSGGSPLSPGCSTANCEPEPFRDPSYGAPLFFKTGPPCPSVDCEDHSNLWKNVGLNTCPNFDYALWKGIALSGGKDLHYFAYDSASQLFRDEDGTLTNFRNATDGRNGLFFFDTTDGLRPHDDDFDGTYNNLTPDIQMSGGAWQASGFIYLNAGQFRTTGNGNVTSNSTITAPAEPFIDQNGNGVCDDGEYVIGLSYPAAYDGTFGKTGIYQQNAGYVRQDPNNGIGTGGVYSAPINMVGVFYTNGIFDMQGNWSYYGSVITKEGMNSGSGNPQIYFDERLTRGGWPPASLNLPRTVFSVWETDM